MDDTDLDAFENGIGKQVVIGFRDGEVTLARPLLILPDENQVVIYDVVSTNRQGRYKRIGAAYEAAFADIEMIAGPEVLAALLGVLFSPDEEPIFIDGSASVAEISCDTAKFSRSAQEALKLSIDNTHLAMTVPELALHLRRTKR